MLHVYKLLLSLAAVSAVASAEYGMHHTSDITDGEMPCSQNTPSETSTGLMGMLKNHILHSSEMLKNFFHSGPANDAVRIVTLEEQQKEKEEEEEEEEENDLALDRKTACLKAVKVIHERDELQHQTETFVKYIHTAVSMITMQVWGGASCTDLGRPELVDQCKLVMKSKDVVHKFLQEGKTDDQVCDIISSVSDLDTTNDLSCQLCERFLLMIDNAEEDEEKVHRVRETIADLCDVLSTDSMCHTFLKNYDAIVEWSKYDTKTLAACSRLAMC